MIAASPKRLNPLHAATRAGAEDERGREALLKYILRPPLATERLVPGPDGLVRIVLKRPFSDGTVAPRAPARDPPYTQSRVLRRRPDEHSAQRALFDEH